MSNLAVIQLLSVVINGGIVAWLIATERPGALTSFAVAVNLFFFEWNLVAFLLNASGWWG